MSWKYQEKVEIWDYKEYKYIILISPEYLQCASQIQIHSSEEFIFVKLYLTWAILRGFNRINKLPFFAQIFHSPKKTE